MQHAPAKLPSKLHMQLSKFYFALHDSSFNQIATTICAILTFDQNPWNNALQLQNSIRFLASGMSTALTAMKTLSKDHKQHIKDAMAWIPGLPLAPTICIDNIDMMQHIHQQSIGVCSHTYRLPFALFKSLYHLWTPQSDGVMTL
ncbi:hypothetical protein VP01_3058g2 [Puccinia sorghi]|uniref:Uncharacterized protein n=1 Tax=Puccinia sorghi TaxID=27349 RepID=A0A0L6V0M7_9BASI|nr:hypothetical protein VP01_3058g2 [Puccinia sorghi]